MLDYDSSGRLTEDQSGPLNVDGSGSLDALYTYDENTGVLNEVDEGEGTIYQIVVAAALVLDEEAAPNADEAYDTVEDGLENTSKYILDYEGRPLEEVSPKGETASWKWNTHGQVTTYTDARGLVTSYSYDDSEKGAGDLRYVANPDGSYVAYQYDPKFHEVTSEERPGPGDATETISNVYDDEGELISSTDPMGVVTTYDWIDGLLMSSTDGRGKSTTYDYDENRRLIEEVDPLGYTTYFTYDDAGNLATTKDGRGKTSSTTYDADNRLIEVEDPDGDVTNTEYNALGEVIKTTDPRGVVTLNVYDDRGFLVENVQGYGEMDAVATDYELDADGRVTLMVDGDQHQTSYLYDKDGRRTKVITPDGSTSTLYDADGNITETIDANGNAVTFVYDDANRRVEEIDPYGTISTVYDLAGDVVSEINADGDATNYEYDLDGHQLDEQDADGSSSTLYDTDGNVTQTTDADGNVVSYVYDDDDRLIATINAAGASMTLYDADGNVTETIDPDNNVTTYVYDDADRLIEEHDPIGTITTLYDADGNVTETIDADGHATTYLYDDLGRQIAEIDPIGTITTQYDSVGNIAEIIDQNGKVTKFLYDEANRQIAEIDPIGTITTHYDPAGNIISVIDGDGHETSYAYDEENRQISRTDADGTTQTFYDAAGNITETIDADGHATTYHYDGAGRLTETDAPIGVTETIYDAEGNVTESIDPDGRVTTYLYDALNRLIEEIDPVGVLQTLYDADGNVTETIDANGDVTSFTYDGDGRQITESTASGTTTTEYDAAGNVITITDPDGNATNYVYDDDNRLTLMTDPLGEQETYAYDDAGNLTLTVDRDGRRRQMSYNGDDELTGETWFNANGSVQNVLSYTYDSAGNLLSASNNAGSYGFTYDGAGRLLTETTPFGITLSFGYDPAGNVTSVTDSHGVAVQSSYDADNRLTHTSLGGSVNTPLAADFTYDGDGQLQTIIRSFGASSATTVAETVYTYDGDGRVIEIKHSGVSDTFGDDTYTYDTGGRLISETINGVTTTYAYDNANQLTQAGDDTYAYDANGNRSSDSIGAGNQILSDGVWNYSYDNEGNRIAKTSPGTGITWAYTYDNANRLTSATETDAQQHVLYQVNYLYDVFGNRIEQDTWWSGDLDPTVTRTLYNGDQVWADLNGNNGEVTDYLNGAAVDEILAREGTSDSGTWYLADIRGSVEALLSDATGDLIDELTYDAFGNLSDETDPSVGDRFKYDGGQYDAATGLYYFEARYYDPFSGVWLSEDPTGFEAGDSNLYRYAGNDPTNATDPSGLAWSFSATFQSAYSSVKSTTSAVANSVSQAAAKAQSLATNAAQQVSAIGTQVADKVQEEIQILPDTLAALPQAVADTMESGEAADSLMGFLAQSQVINAVTLGQSSKLSTIYGHEEAFANAGAVSQLYDEATKQVLINAATAGAGKAICAARQAVANGQIAGRAAQAVNGLATAAKAANVGLNASNAVSAADDLVEAYQSGDGLKFAQALVRFGSSAYNAQAAYRQSCFVAGTPLRTPEGSRLIEEFQVGDLLLSRPEHDLEGAIEVKAVEEVFVRTAFTLRLQVAGREIETTSEHPLFVKDKGWVACGNIHAGELLASEDGQWLEVEAISDPGEFTTVYNLRIADYHTYFVGSVDWGFAVWAHNSNYGEDNAPSTSPPTKLRTITSKETAESVNSTFPANFHPPYKPGTQVSRFTTGTEEAFVRVHGQGNQQRAWMMKKEAIRGLSSAQIQSKYALPDKPTFVSDVKVPAGTKMEYGTVNPGFPGVPPGGRARQYRVLERLDASAFTNMRPLE